MPGPGMDLIGEEEIQEVLKVMRSGYLFRYGVSLGAGGRSAVFGEGVGSGAARSPGIAGDATRLPLIRERLPC